MAMAPAYILRNRPNKTAKGMTRTLYRSNHKLEGDALGLSVRGTLAKSALNFKTMRIPCPCCGCKCRGKLALNDNGRFRLQQLRARYVQQFVENT